MSVKFKMNEDDPLRRPSGEIMADMGFAYVSAERMRRKIVQYEELQVVLEAIAERQTAKGDLQARVTFNQILRPVAESYSEKERYMLALDDLL